MWRVTNRVPIASIARPDDPILSFELPMAMTGLGQPKKGSRRAYVFRNGPASCRKRTVPALTINPKTRQNDE
jgi:hypothetical protein